MSTSPVRYFDTLAPGKVSDELRPVVDELGLVANCDELAEQGWTVVTGVGDTDLHDRLRVAVLAASGVSDETHAGGSQMLLTKDPAFAEVVLAPELLALAEFSVGRGFLLSQVAGSVKPQGGGPIGLHADHNWMPAPFPEHNMLLTACWATDGYTEAGGATTIIPGSNRLRRHPDAAETAAEEGAIAIECPPGSVVVWDGNVWHSSATRTDPGQRVVCHVTYTRLCMRPVEDYSPWADELIAGHGDRMAQLLGRHDGLFEQTGFDYRKLVQTFNNAKR